ncbi:MAG: hypothetical protein COV79_03215 [Parcubacteria group bacterium CG11_big_fil_rev_8_21_14_0_20_41_14]|nr:MAG: hypothetical protein COV79_03215 [Parcubacteria group bacterium CG11_big_fil_rev_8_21_14_0_20_41_14]
MEFFAYGRAFLVLWICFASQMDVIAVSRACVYRRNNRNVSMASYDDSVRHIRCYAVQCARGSSNQHDFGFGDERGVRGVILHHHKFRTLDVVRGVRA